MRIQKFLSRAGSASRRKAETMIVAGRVRINGKTVTELGVTVDPERDRIELDGVLVQMPTQRWIRFHKPLGVLTTAQDTHGRQTIYDLLPPEHRNLRYVGRLDRDTKGLLLLTNDGDLANRIQHPRYQVEREYEVRVKAVPPSEVITLLRTGVMLDDGLARPTRVEVRPPLRGFGRLRLVMTEGRKREVRRLLDAVGHPVVALKRIRFGPIRLEGLPVGEWSELTEDDVRAIRSSVSEP